jgi:fructose-bisphosphate aldolase, class I
MSVLPRLNRLLAADGKCFDVAIDHGFFGELSFLPSIENMQKAVQTVVEAAPDVVQLSLGQAWHLQHLRGSTKPALALRTDVANVYGSSLPSLLFSEMIESPLEQALRLDAVCIVVNLLMLPNQPELHRACIKNILRLKPEAERFGMPLMIEPLVMQDNSSKGGYKAPVGGGYEAPVGGGYEAPVGGGYEAPVGGGYEAPVGGGYMVDGNLEKILPLVRQAVELGADIIKADPCDNILEYHKVIEIAGGIPVLVRGGGRVSDTEILERTYGLMQQGASGIVYGRNVIQHPNPAGITRALMAVVHDGATPSQAANLIGAA